jgi:hypothetical protein
MYIKELDLLFKLPRFNYHSVTSNKILGTIQGLVVLYCILNTDIKLWYRECGDFPQLRKSGWTKAFNASKAAYSSEIVVEQPGDHRERTSPTPPLNEEASNDENMQLWVSKAKKRNLGK